MPVLDAPQGLQVVLGGTVGMVTNTWMKVKHAKLYMVEYGPVGGTMIFH